MLRLELQADRFFQNSQLRNRVLRVDKYVYSASSMGGSYDSLAKIMENNEKADRLRRLFLSKEKPRIEAKIPRQQLQDAKSLIKPLPKEQQLAAVKCLMAVDYVFIDTKNCSGNFFLRIGRKNRAMCYFETTDQLHCLFIHRFLV